MAANPVPPVELNLATTEAADESVIRCSGRITSSTTGQLQKAVRDLIPRTKCVVIDLTDVTYMDSSGLGTIIGVYMTARRQNCGIKLIHLNQRLQELFRITKLSSVFQGHGDYLGWTPD